MLPIEVNTFSSLFLWWSDEGTKRVYKVVRPLANNVFVSNGMCLVVSSGTR